MVSVAVEDLTHGGVAADDCHVCAEGSSAKLLCVFGVLEVLPSCCRADVGSVPDYAVDQGAVGSGGEFLLICL